jgi:hypothetical protein
MNTRGGSFAGLLAVGMALAGLVSAQEVHLKTRDIEAATPVVALTPGDTHQLVQFDHVPSVDDLAALLAAGAQVVSVVPDNAVVVSSPGAVVPRGAGIRLVTRIDPVDKLSPELGNGVGPYTAIVEFHPDVPAESQNAVAQTENVALLRPPALIANHAIVTGSLADLAALASHDEVAYIFPAEPALLTDSGFSACAGMLTLSGPIAQYSNLVHGWDLDSGGVAHLGYVFGTLTTEVPAALVQSEIVRALNSWTWYTNVSFSPGTDAAAARTVAIRFASGAHGDAYRFDGPGGILAHTFYPVPVNPESIAGDMHLDADENWHVGGDVDIYSVALHEAGHAIGLGHSDKPGDVMYPYYRRGMSLSANDIGAAQALYGLPLESVVPSPLTQTPPAPAPAPLHLTLDPAPASTASAQAAVTGTVSGGTPPVTVQWQTDHGYSGQASLGSSAWTASGISLVNGSNTISVTAFDSNHGTATQIVAISLVPAASSAPSGSGSVPVSVSITTPSSAMVSVNTASLAIAGTAGGGAGIARVTCGRQWWRSGTEGRRLRFDFGQVAHDLLLVGGITIAEFLGVHVGAAFVVGKRSHAAQFLGHLPAPVFGKVEELPRRAPDLVLPLLRKAVQSFQSRSLPRLRRRGPFLDLIQPVGDVLPASRRKILQRLLALIGAHLTQPFQQLFARVRVGPRCLLLLRLDGLRLGCLRSRRVGRGLLVRGKRRAGQQRTSYR